MPHRAISNVPSPDSDPTPQRFDLRNDPDLCWAAWVFCAGITVISAGMAVYMLWLR